MPRRSNKMRSSRRKSAVIGGRRRRGASRKMGGVPATIQNAKERKQQLEYKQKLDRERHPGLFGSAALAPQPIPSFMPASMRPNNR